MPLPDISEQESCDFLKIKLEKVALERDELLTELNLVHAEIDHLQKVQTAPVVVVQEADHAMEEPKGGLGLRDLREMQQQYQHEISRQIHEKAQLQLELHQMTKKLHESEEIVEKIKQEKEQQHDVGDKDIKLKHALDENSNLKNNVTVLEHKLRVSQDEHRLLLQRHEVETQRSSLLEERLKDAN